MDSGDSAFLVGLARGAMAARIAGSAPNWDAPNGFGAYRPSLKGTSVLAKVTINGPQNLALVPRSCQAELDLSGLTESVEGLSRCPPWLLAPTSPQKVDAAQSALAYGFGPEGAASSLNTLPTGPNGRSFRSLIGNGRHLRRRPHLLVLNRVRAKTELQGYIRSMRTSR